MNETPILYMYANTVLSIHTNVFSSFQQNFILATRKDLMLSFVYLGGMFQ